MIFDHACPSLSRLTHRLHPGSMQTHCQSFVANRTLDHATANGRCHREPSRWIAPDIEVQGTTNIFKIVSSALMIYRAAKVGSAQNLVYCTAYSAIYVRPPYPRVLRDMILW